MSWQMHEIYREPPPTAAALALKQPQQAPTKAGRQAAAFLKDIGEGEVDDCHQFQPAAGGFTERDQEQIAVRARSDLAAPQRLLLRKTAANT